MLKHTQEQQYNKDLFEENYKLNVYDNQFISTAAITLSNANGVVFNNNTYS